jgi:hypothetical protein
LVAEIKAGCGNGSVLDSETVKATWTPPENEREGYALGWQVVDDPVRGRFVVHGGALENYRSFLFLNPKERFGFALLMNQGGLLPSALGFTAARDGLLKIIHGEKAENGPAQWPVAVVSGIFFFVLGVGVYGTMRLRSWSTRVARKKPWKRWLSGCIELAASCFLLFGFIPLMNHLMGDKADWAMLYGLLPELFFLLVLLIFFGFFRFLMKFWMLHGPQPRDSHIQ